MQSQPQVNFGPPPGQVYQENMQPQLQGEFINPPPLPPGRDRGIFAPPLPHGQPPAPPVAVQGVSEQSPQVGSKLDPVELVNIVLRFVAVLMTFIATVIVGTTKHVNSKSFDPEDVGNWGGEHPRRYTTSYYSPYASYSGYSRYYLSPPPPPPYESEDSGLPLILITRLSSLSPIKYFLAANSIVLFYSVATLGISVASLLMKNKTQQRGGLNGSLRSKVITLFVVGDLVMVVFLFSAVGSIAAAKGAFKSDFYNAEICGASFNAFCQKWTAGIVMSMFGAIVYLLLQLLSVFSLTKMNTTTNK